MTTFIDVLAEKNLRNSDVAKATGFFASQTCEVLAGKRLVRETGYRGMPSEMTLLATLFDLSPDKIREISHASVARHLQAERDRPPPKPERTEP